MIFFFQLITLLKNAEHLGIIDISEVILDDHSPGPLGGVPKGPTPALPPRNDLTSVQYL